MTRASTPATGTTPAVVAQDLGEWAVALAPDPEDRTLADRALLDTVGVGIAAREHEILRFGTALGEAGRWATACHILDFDDLHMESTTHISAVCVPVALTTGGGAGAYLAGAGVMARIGSALGWPHYAQGWHATTSAGALGAAVTASVARGLTAEQTARAMALAVPAAGGVQRAFGTDAKSLQVGFAADAGVRAAELAAAGASADLAAVDAWMRLVGGDPEKVDLSGPAVPGGLAMKIYPACYALQRPISAVRSAAVGVPPVDPASVRRVHVRTPAATVRPLIHHRPRTGLEGKFSLEYGVATALLDPTPGFDAFSDAAVNRPEAQRLVELVETTLDDAGQGLLAGQVEVEIATDDATFTASLEDPPGSPQRPPRLHEHAEKMATCLAGSGVDASAITWETAADRLRRTLDRR